MWSFVVVVAYECPMCVEEMCLVDVGFMECFYLSDGGGSSFAGSDMAYSKFSTVLCEL